MPRGGGRGLRGIRPRWARSLDSRDVWLRDGVRVTSPARTVLDLAVSTAPIRLRRIARQAQAEQRVNVRQLLEVLAGTPATAARRSFAP